MTLTANIRSVDFPVTKLDENGLTFAAMAWRCHLRPYERLPYSSPVSQLENDDDIESSRIISNNKISTFSLYLLTSGSYCHPSSLLSDSLIL